MSELKQPEISRRQFLNQGTAMAAGVTLAPGIALYSVAHASPKSTGASKEVRWGMLVNTNECSNGCDDCVTACQCENGWGGSSSNEKHSSAEQQAQWIRKVTLTNNSTGSAHSLPVMCQHCENPPCVDVCPTGASFKRADGVVLVDRHICIGCRYCMMACPYKARSFVHEALEGQLSHMPRGKGTVEACTLCVHKLDNGDGTSACAQACSKGAIIVGDLNDKGSEIAQQVAKHATTQIRADLGLNPGVRYRGI